MMLLLLMASSRWEQCCNQMRCTAATCGSWKPTTWAYVHAPPGTKTLRNETNGLRWWRLGNANLQRQRCSELQLFLTAALHQRLSVAQEAAACGAEVNQLSFPHRWARMGRRRTDNGGSTGRNVPVSQTSPPSDSEQIAEGTEARRLQTWAWLSEVMELLKWFWWSSQLTKGSQRYLKSLCCLLPKVF